MSCSVFVHIKYSKELEEKIKSENNDKGNTYM